MKISKRDNNKKNTTEINEVKKLEEKNAEKGNYTPKEENQNMSNVEKIKGDVVTITYNGLIGELNDDRRRLFLAPILECDICKKRFEDKEQVFKALECSKDNFHEYFNTYYICPKCATINLKKIKNNIDKKI